MSHLDIRNASPELVRVLYDACEELARTGYHITPAELLAIRQRQATGEIQVLDPPPTIAESPKRTVRAKMGDGKYQDVTFDRDYTPGLSPLDGAVRKMRSAAYAFNQEDYTACAVMAREAFLEVQAALKDKTFMDVSVEIVEPDVIEVKEVKELTQVEYDDDHGGRGYP